MAMAGCSPNSNGGSAQINPGTVQGYGIDEKDTQAFPVDTKDGAGANLVVVITDTPNLCDNAKGKIQPKGGATLEIELVDPAFQGSADVSVGDYPIADPTTVLTSPPAGRYALALFKKFKPGTCDSAFDETKGTAMSGTVTVGHYSNGPGSTHPGIEGSFDLKFVDSGDSLSGNFVSPICNAVATEFSMATCQ